MDDVCFSEGPICMRSVVGSSSKNTDLRCEFGQHPRGPVLHIPSEDEVLVRISRAKTQLLQTRWNEAGGRGQLCGAWQVRNRRLDRLFRASAHNLLHDIGHTSDMIDGWHGTQEENVLSIARNGFDPSRRSGQVFGAGEYFAKDPNVSISYARGGAFMFLCKLLLGRDGVDHTWVDEQKYYVVKQREGLYQALPVYVVQIQPSSGRLAEWFGELSHHELEEEGTLKFRQRGGQSACEARREAGMVAQSTQHLWVGWLAPELSRASDDAIGDDVSDFLKGVHVVEVIPERNGARVGAFVRLKEPINKDCFKELSSRRYRGRFRISVDDQQSCNPKCSGKACPRLAGPSGYCRGWNIGGHRAWQWGCPFSHPKHLRPTHGASFSLEDILPRTAKYDEIQTSLMQSAPFHDGIPRLVGVKRVINRALEDMYEKRRNFLTEKHGVALEKELWHGTNCKALPELLSHGLQPPSDISASDACPVSGGKGLCTTLCGRDCPHCSDPHVWNKCHMYGGGVYMADLAQKSHRYVRQPEVREIAAPSRQRPTWGVGAQIVGEEWDVWGVVVGDEGDVWRLEGGRIAKKENEGLRWWFDDASGECSGYDASSSGVGATIQGLDGSVWGLVVGDGGTIWQLQSGRIAKKASEGTRWVWRKEVSSSTITAEVYSMLWCRVCLGSPYLIEGNLLSPDAMHDFCWCQDPSDKLETVAEDWNVAKGHDTFYVRGLNGAQRSGLGVYNSEYIVFQPFQVLPLYRVDYVIERGY